MPAGVNWGNYLYWSPTGPAYEANTTDSVFLGENSGLGQVQEHVAIGSGAGDNPVGIGTIAIGAGAGGQQGDYAVALGYQANSVNQPANSIVISADPGNMPATVGGTGLYIAPIKSNSASVNNYLQYNTTSMEVTYNPSIFGTGPTGPTGFIGSIGTLDTLTGANGASLTGSALVLQSASSFVPGLVNNTLQTMSGYKTFSGSLQAPVVNAANNQIVYVISTSTGLMYSNNLATFTAVTWANPSVLLTSSNSVIYANGYFVATGVGNTSATIFYSTNGITWTAASWTGFDFNVGTVGGYYVTYINNDFWVGGYASSLNLPFAFTTNGDPTGSWSGFGGGLFANAGGHQGFCAMYNPSYDVYTFTGNGSNVAYVVHSGIPSTVALSGQPGYCAYINGYSVVCNKGTNSIYIAPDGINFDGGTGVFSSGPGAANYVTYRNGVWVLSGYNTSSTPTTTTAYSASISPDGTFTAGAAYYNALPYGASTVFLPEKNRFYMMGANTVSPSILYYSDDGITWNTQATVSVAAIFSLASNFTVDGSINSNSLNIANNTILDGNLNVNRKLFGTNTHLDVTSAINLNVLVNFLDSDSTNYTLAVGAENQLIYIASLGTSNTVTGDFSSARTTITFGSIDSNVTLYYSSVVWAVIGGFDITLS